MLMSKDNRQREIQRLETLLNRCRWEKQQIQIECKAKDHLIQRLNKQNAVSQSAKNHFASSNHLKQEDSEALQQKISSLQQLLKEQAYQISYLQQSKSQILKEVEHLQQSITSSSNIILEKDILIYSLRLKLKELQEIRKIQQEQIQTLNKNIENHCNQKLKLVQENSSLMAQFKYQQNDRQNKFKMLFQGLNVISSQMKQKKEPKAQKASEKASDEKLILKIQQQELQQRNEEILRLRTILDGVQVPMEEAHLRNTIKHLRSQLSKYNVMIAKILQKQQFAQCMAKKHAQLIKKYEKEIQDLKSLKGQNLELKKNTNDQEVQIKMLNEQMCNDKKRLSETKAILIESLKQNQSYHQLMFEWRGSNYEFYIEKQISKCMDRLNERAKKQKWVTIDELIDVNQKLRERLKLI